ncbi:hypothetical protein [Rhodococcus sp. 14-2483-1-2]|uniref:hypothetical protein n=1 Tax=Rhodococcus sp. 14-2483-1-2 TaxID=2023147 RepID=UPI000B9C6178|nr:hypothetical protein [Rhodococcus sp. 14-2483-1-2]OZF26210.1 hypothetical protein CH295_26760 [Rhodococcus sp. 14-2483-1-2]
MAATLAHADELIGEVASLLFDYQTQPEGTIQLREVPMITHSQTVVVSMSPMPRKIVLLVADALVVLRNAIEHTLFAEVEYRDGTLDEKAAKVVEMPAAQTYDAFSTWLKSRAKNGPPSLQRGSEFDQAHRKAPTLPPDGELARSPDGAADVAHEPLETPSTSGHGRPPRRHSSRGPTATGPA